MSIESLKIKKQSYYYWNDIAYIDDFYIKYLKINKRESRVGIDIYYIGYVLYKLEYITNSVVPLDGFNKIRFSSDINLPLGKLIEFKVLTIIIKCIIKKNDKYYPEIYLDECLYRRV